MYMMLLQLLLLAAGFVLLIKGADFFVKGASAIAHKFGVPQIIIGLTIVAMGTSAPEAAVSISAALSGNADITIGNVVGSNIINILLILGITSVIAPLLMEKNTIRIDIPFTILVTAIVIPLGMTSYSINRPEGVLLLLLFVIYLLYLFTEARKNKSSSSENEKPVYGQGNIWTILLTVLGLAMIVAGSQLTVHAATELALGMGVSQRIIGLTIVAFGTSLPELVTSATAAYRGHAGLAVGNIVGSNIFNILFVTGITAAITPVKFIPPFVPDTAIAAGAAALLFVLVLPKQRLGRAGGIIMLICYAAYFASILFLK